MAEVATPAVSESSHTPPEVVLLFLFVSLALGAACKHALTGTKVPYTVAILLLGVAMGAIDFETHGLGTLSLSIDFWKGISGDLVLYIFLPALVFASSFAINPHFFYRKLFGQILLLAGPGVLLSAFLIALVGKYVFPYSWGWKISLLFGAILSATDPVAVVALLREVGASKKLSTVIDGEALVNDGTAIVLFTLFNNLVQGDSYNVVRFMFRATLGSYALGLGFALAATLWLVFVFHDGLIEITITLCSCYLAFFVAQYEAGMSGVLAVVALGTGLGLIGRTAFTGEVQAGLHYFWEMVEYIANTVIFILAGVIIIEKILQAEATVRGRDVGYAVLLYVLLQVIRGIMFTVFYPILRVTGYGITWRDAIIMVWGGLRGAVALALALVLQLESAIDAQTGTLILFHIGMTVLFTLVINGSTTTFLLSYLGMNKISAAKRRIIRSTKRQIRLRAQEAYDRISAEDDVLGEADFNTVAEYVGALRDEDDNNNDDTHSQERQKSLTRSRTSIFSMGNVLAHANEEQRMELLADVRARFLQSLKAAYWTMLEEGRLRRRDTIMLNQAVDVALDQIDTPLDDWEELKGFASRVPKWVLALKHSAWVRRSWLVSKIAHGLMFGRLESAMTVCAGFVWGHAVARVEMENFFLRADQRHFVDTVLEESRRECTAAQEFIEDVKAGFPEVLRAIKTKQVARAVLWQEELYIKQLEESGLLDDKELAHLTKGTNTDVKRLLRHPPAVGMPSPADRLRQHPFVQALRPDLADMVVARAQEKNFQRGDVIASDSLNANSLVLLVTGHARVTFSPPSSAAGTHHAAHMHRVVTFKSGSVLGSYGALTRSNNPQSGVVQRLTLIEADSIVQAFLLPAEHVRELCMKDPVIETVLYKAAVEVLISVRFYQELFEHCSRLAVHAVISRAQLRSFDAVPIDETPQQQHRLVLDQEESGLLLLGSLIAPTGQVLNAPEALPANDSESTIYIVRSMPAKVLVMPPLDDDTNNDDNKEVSDDAHVQAVHRRVSVRHSLSRRTSYMDVLAEEDLIIPINRQQHNARRTAAAALFDNLAPVEAYEESERTRRLSRRASDSVLSISTPSFMTQRQRKQSAPSVFLPLNGAQKYAREESSSGRESPSGEP
eukprot:jgi/Chlat1/1376/Chrsp119S01786